MRFGNLRGVKLALGFAAATALTLALSAGAARAQGLHTIPRLVPGTNANTGQPYYAPPVPYGHYAGKNIGGRLSGKVHGLLGGHGLGSGSGCGACGGSGCDACGSGGGLHSGRLFGKFKGIGSGCGACGGGGCNSCLGNDSMVVTSEQGMPTSQSPGISSPECGDPGCGLLGKHKNGCGLFGKGCGTGAGGLCGGCGGKGCGLCGGLSKAKGLANHLLGRDKIKWFVGPGGPVPLTPGYTPYVNVTRSPREFLAFPPFTP